MAGGAGQADKVYFAALAQTSAIATASAASPCSASMGL